MQGSKSKLGKAGVAAAAVVAAAAMSASQWALGQACPDTGCSIPGITVPNGIRTCAGNGQPLANTDVNTTLCNTQPIDPANWVYGPNTDLTPAQAAASYWNQVQTRMTQGLPVIGRRVSTGGLAGASDMATAYCSVAAYDDANNHFTWADQRFSGLDGSQLWRVWLNTACPALTLATTAARGAMGSSIDEREAQHDADGGAIVFFRPVNSVRDAQEIVFWTFYPPFGHRSQGGNQGATIYGQLTEQGGYRNSYNRNAVMIAQIATVAGARAAAGIAALDGIDALYLDDEDLAFQATGVADYNQLASGVKAAAAANSKYLCTVDRTAEPNVMTCVLPTKLSAAELAKREPLRRLDGSGMPMGSTRMAGVVGRANRED